MEAIVRSMGVLLMLQAIIIILSIFLLRYHKEVDAVYPDIDKVTATKILISKYPVFQDVHVMIFIGFGFLMTFLRKYGFSSVGFTFLLTSVMIQWSILCQGVFKINKSDHKIPVDLMSLLNADIAAATVIISMGALLGRTTPLQLIIMGLIESILFSGNEFIQHHLKVTDIGGSMVVHVFGAYFGLAVSKILGPPKGDNLPETSSYTSDMFAMIGTIFLWVFWPSFNGALADGDEQHRAIINTYLSLAACCVTAYALSAILSEHKKFDMVHIQNSTIAGGVAVGTSADLMIQPYGALIVGVLAGTVSVVGYRYITPFLLKKFKLYDTCGINNLHGMPGILAGITGAIAAWLASEKEYGLSLYLQFPARAPIKDSIELGIIQGKMTEVKPGDGRSGFEQATFQLLQLVITFSIAIIGGIITGIILKSRFVNSIPEGGAFQDEIHWEVPETESLHKIKIENHEAKIEEEKC
ncbi:rhesus blood group-associated glycoprotein Rh50 isoform X2 [Lycorma delicatula]